jgi:SAM-dependent methyltransferase
MQQIPDRTRELVTLIETLKRSGYTFVAPTPATHQVVVGRRKHARDLRDVFGWSLPFPRGVVPPEIFAALKAAGAFKGWFGGRATVRGASLGGDLFLHSAFPTHGEDDVFFGPDSYRFARFLLAELDDRPVATLVDVGAGTGVGAIVAAKRVRPARTIMTDVNPQALAFARANAAAAGIEAEFFETAGLEGVEGPLDLVIANPPFIADPKGLAYRDGGGQRGIELSLEWARQAMRRLAPGGRLLLYTGVAIVEGRNPLFERLAHEADGFELRLEEIDPDIFGEELAKPAYSDVERIAAVGAVVTRRR